MDQEQSRLEAIARIAAQLQREAPPANVHVPNQMDGGYVAPPSSPPHYRMQPGDYVTGAMNSATGDLLHGTLDRLGFSDLAAHNREMERRFENDFGDIAQGVGALIGAYPGGQNLTGAMQKFGLGASHLPTMAQGAMQGAQQAGQELMALWKAARTPPSAQEMMIRQGREILRTEGPDGFHRWAAAQSAAAREAAERSRAANLRHNGEATVEIVPQSIGDIARARVNGVPDPATPPASMPPAGNPTVGAAQGPQVASPAPTAGGQQTAGQQHIPPGAQQGTTGLPTENVSSTLQSPDVLMRQKGESIADLIARARKDKMERDKLLSDAYDNATAAGAKSSPDPIDVGSATIGASGKKSGGGQRIETLNNMKVVDSGGGNVPIKDHIKTRVLSAMDRGADSITLDDAMKGFKGKAKPNLAKAQKYLDEYQAFAREVGPDRARLLFKQSKDKTTKGIVKRHGQAGVGALAADQIARALMGGEDM